MDMLLAFDLSKMLWGSFQTQGLKWKAHGADSKSGVLDRSSDISPPAVGLGESVSIPSGSQSPSRPELVGHLNAQETCINVSMVCSTKPLSIKAVFEKIAKI